MKSHIIFPKNTRREALELWRVNSASVSSAWNKQTDTAELILPRNIIDFDKQKVNDYFRVGDKVEFHLGANTDDYIQEFKGYVTSVSADIPVTIKCEDEMWKLKQLPVNVSQKQTTLPKLLRAIAPNYTIDALEVELGTVRFRKTTVAEVLSKLKSDFGLNSYFDGDTLVVGKIYQDNTKTIDLHLEKDVLKNNLEYKNKDDVKVKLKAISTTATGEKIEVEVGEEGGTQIQLSYFNVSSKSALEKLAKVDLEKYNQAGFKGDVEVLGNVDVKHGDKANISSDLYPERNGLYYIDEVGVKFIDSPVFRKILKIGRKATP